MCTLNVSFYGDLTKHYFSVLNEFFCSFSTKTAVFNAYNMHDIQDLNARCLSTLTCILETFCKLPVPVPLFGWEQSGILRYTLACELPGQSHPTQLQWKVL